MPKTSRTPASTNLANSKVLSGSRTSFSFALGKINMHLSIRQGFKFAKAPKKTSTRVRNIDKWPKIFWATWKPRCSSGSTSTSKSKTRTSIPGLVEQLTSSFWRTSNSWKCSFIDIKISFPENIIIDSLQKLIVCTHLVWFWFQICLNWYFVFNF